jgi:AcrR family transcriptional regulator
VLGEEGSRGLTHRAVDEAAGLPSGSTSNHFRTREALLEAAARRHAELDLPPTSEVEEVTETEAALSWEQVRALLLANLDRILDPAGRAVLTARYELALESIRRPALHEVMDDSRQRFAGLAEVILRAGGCADPEGHSRQLIALLDGIAVDQLQETSRTLDRPGIEQLLDRFLASC